MSQRIEIAGEHLEDALQTFVAEYAGVERQQVEYRVRVPGMDLRRTGPIELVGVVDEEEDLEDASSNGHDAHGTDEEAAIEEEAVVAPVDQADLEEEADAAADFVEGLLDELDLPGDLHLHFGEGHVDVEIVDVDSGTLIGRRGQTLEAIQELARCSLQRKFERRSHVRIDVEGYRARRLEKILEKADDAIDEVLDGGESVRLEPMDVFDRREVHELVAEVEGVVSRSHGREPGRRVVISPAE